MNVVGLFDAPMRGIRVPESQSVRLPGPFARMIDHPDFQRLRRVRQLGPIHLVYPGAVHTRFEHSLGVFWAATSYLEGLLSRASFRDRVGREDVLVLLAAALLHDVGHYPFAHSLEALHSRAFEAPRHEDLAGAIISGTLSSQTDGPAIGDLVEDDLGVSRARVSQLVQIGCSPALPSVDRLLASVINSAIDADKLDYLERDSIHMGVPYGRMPDRERLTANLTVNRAGDRIALTEKGRVSGEIFLFCRYLMFSEAYWHRTVRSASAMIEAALADYVRREQPSEEGFVHLLLGQSDDELLGALARSGPEDCLCRRLLAGLTVNERGLYKRVLTLSRQRDHTERQRAYDAVYQMDRAELEELSGRMARRLSRLAGVELPSGSLLIDTPPRDKDRMDSVPVVLETGAEPEEVPLEDLSTVVRGIARDFVKVVKKIRVFVAPDIRARLVDKRGQAEDALLGEILG